MRKTIKHGVINSTDELNLYILNSLTLEEWIKVRHDAPDAPFHFENTALYIIKMLEFKCIDLNMEMEDILELFHIEKGVYKEIILKYHSYKSENFIIYPYFIVTVTNVPDICSVIQYYIKSQEQYET
jgi:hypothetical protein